MPDELNQQTPGTETPQGTGTETTQAVDTGTQGTGQESPNQENIRQLRENYERVNKEYEPYRGLGKPDELKASHEFYSKHWTEAQRLAQQLGFKAENLQSAWAQDPIQTLAYMRQELAKRDSSTDPRVLSDRAIAEARRVTQEMLGPIQEREATRRADEATFSFDTAWQGLFGKAFPDEATRPPQEFAEELYNLTAELMKDDQDAINNLLAGKSSDVQKYFDMAKGRLLKLVAKYGQAEQQRVNGSGNQNKTPANGKKKATLDEIFEKPELVNAKYAAKS